MPTGKPITSGSSERLTRSARRWTRATQRPGDRPELRPDDHRSDDQDRRVEDHSDSGDQAGQHHEHQEAAPRAPCSPRSAPRPPPRRRRPTGSPSPRASARSAASEIWESMSSIAIEPVLVDPELAAGRSTITLASSRATSQRITSPSGFWAAPSRKIEIDDRRRRLEQLHRVLGVVGRSRRSAGGPRPDSVVACSPTTTCTCGPTTSARPTRRSPRRTSSATSRRPRLRGSTSSASPSTSTASPRRSSCWRHPFWEGQAHDDLDAYCEFVKTTPLKLGIEADFIRGAEDRIASLLEARDFDYVVGSVHFLGERRGRGRPPLRRLEVRRRTPTSSGAATSSGSPRRRARACSTSSPTPTWSRSGGTTGRCPRRTRATYYEPAVEAIAETGIAVEVSTAGLRKHVGEIYPSPAFAEMCVEAGAAFALSSDAHAPDQVGFGYEKALEFLDDLGVDRDLRVRGPRATADRAASTPVSEPAGLMAPRVGIGYDSHRLVEGESLILGGVEIEHDEGPRGPLRRRRADPRGDRRAARLLRRWGTSASPVPGRRRAVARRGLDGPAADRRRRSCPAAPIERGRHRDLRGAEAGARTGPRWRPTSARRCRLR